MRGFIYEKNILRVLHVLITSVSEYDISTSRRAALTSTHFLIEAVVDFSAI
jgi:hypothetical protein